MMSLRPLHPSADVDAAIYPDWPAPAKVRAFTTLRHGAGLSAAPFDSFNLGARCGDDPQAVIANREELIRHFALPSAPRWLRQVHGTRIVSCDAFAPPLAKAGGGWEGVESGISLSEGLKSKALPLPNSPSPAGRSSLHDLPPADRTNAAHHPLHARQGADHAEPVADAAMTLTPGVVLAILTADCLPVLFCADDGNEVGIAHAGWRGLAAGVLENTVSAMWTPPGQLMAWFGPAAGAEAYEVGNEVRAAFVERDDADSSAFIPTRPGHWLCDLYALARSRLQAIGIPRVYGGGLCTIRDPQRFYSHRRDQRTGRMATLVWRT